MGTVGRVAAGIGTGGMSEVGNEISGGKLYGSGSTLTGAGGGGKGAPAPPDFASAVDAQAKSGHVNQSNPFGSTSWSQGPDGRWTQSTQFDGGLEQGARSLEGQIANQGPLDNGSAVRQQAIDANYGQAASRLDPQWAQAQEQQTSQLAAQGLDPGSEAYNNAMGNFNRAKNDAYSTAHNNAINNANQAQALTFGENVAAQQLPYQQLSELNGLQSGLSGSGSQTQYLPAAMAAYQGLQNQYATQQASKNSMMGGAANLGAAALIAG